MHQFIKDIILSKKTTSKKEEELNKIIKDIEIAEGILHKKYCYCEDCDDYYLTAAFSIDNETKYEKVCVYEDYINSGGNEYEWANVNYSYRLCPKGHKKILYQVVSR